MNDINAVTPVSGVFNTLQMLGDDNAMVTADQVMNAIKGTASGQSVYHALLDKLESDGVLASGTADPVFANQTALFYHNTTSNKLFVRGTSDYDEISAGHEGANFIGFGTNTPSNRATASDSDPWIYVNTTTHRLWIKEKLGSSYSWTGPIFEGAYVVDFAYSTEDTPSNLNVSWNWQTKTLNATGTGWSRNQGGAKWVRFLIGVPNSPNAIVSADLPVGSVGFEDNVIIGIGSTTPTWNSAHSTTNPLIFYNTSTAELFLKTRSDYRQVLSNAGDVGYDRRNTDTVLGSTVDNVQDALNVLSDQIATLLARPTGGTGTDDQTATEVPTTTTGWGQNIPTTARNVQLALNALNSLAIQPFYEERFPHTNNRLESSTAQYTQSFTIPQKVIDFGNRWDLPLFLIAESNYAVEETTGRNEYVILTYEVLTSDGLALTSPIQMTGHRIDAPSAGSGTVRLKLAIQGVLPRGFTRGQLRTTVTRISTVPPGVGVEFDTVQVWPDPSAIDASMFSGNLSTATNTVQKLANAVDGLTIVGARYQQRAVFTGGSVNSATPTNLGQINLSTEIRDEAALELGYPIRISVGAQVNGAIASGVEGRLYISNGTGVNDTDYGGVNLSSSNADNSAVQLQAILPPDDATPTSSTVPSTVYVMLRRDSGTSAIAVDNGIVFLERDQTNQILNAHEDRYDFNSGERFADELIRIDPSTSQYTINVPQSLLDVRTNENRAIRATVRANLGFQSAGTTNIDFQIRDTAGAVLSPDQDVDQSETRTDTNLFNIETSFELPSTVNGLRLQLSKGTGAGQPNVNFNYFDGFFQVVEPNAFTAKEVLTNTAAPGWSTPLTSHSTDVQLALEELAAGVSGAAGQSERYQENIIWTAGSTPTSRLTTTSTTVLHTLIPGHTWAQYDLLQFSLDTGPDTGIVVPIMITSSSFRISSSFGLLDVIGDYWVRIQPSGTNGFYFLWNGNLVAMRQVLGIKTASR